MISGDVHARSFRQRRTVRIVTPRSVHRVAILTMLGISGVALLCFLGFRALGKSETVVTASHRPFDEIFLSWRCEAGHSFRAAGQVGAGVCPKCNALAYPTEPFECKQHGSFAVAAKFELDALGEAKVAQYRVATRDWLDALIGPTCPKCSEPLERRPRDPLVGIERPKRKETRSPREVPDSDGGVSTP